MMNCTLKCIALTGIGPHVIEELKKGKPRTLELQSAHNLISLTVVSPGDVMLLTPVDLDDFTGGDRGIIVQVISLTINMKRLVEYAAPYHYEERERMSARIQVRYMDGAIAKSVEGTRWGEPTFAEVLRPSHYRAG
ncbi:DUF473 domain-containing protein [Methanogenium organophilum]|uniref:DUF473 domain-containing protein n=1 Tax=Methanogenium organophilum TaxID=2199 RepID=A0A9X9S2U3_METOG|nr:DUF473 domain-containing protein [Methanogenium organophilum]WAI00752.1 DUF473 domain-containing protein [Methanogenium organophilum]